MRNEEIIDFFLNNKQIIPRKSFYSKAHYIGASVYLKNGMYLPCVLFENFEVKVKKETEYILSKNYNGPIEDLIKSSLRHFKFNSQISIHDIDKIQESPYFFSFDNDESLICYPDKPESELNGFVIKFSDGSFHEFDFINGYDLTFFFNKPSNVEFSQIIKIYSLSHLNDNNEIVSYPDENDPEFSEEESKYWADYIKKRKNKNDKIYYNMFHFKCYLDEMEKLSNP